MEPIKVVKDTEHDKVYLQIDVDEEGGNPELMQDLFDIIVAESRRNEEKIPWEQVKKELGLD